MGNGLSDSELDVLLLSDQDGVSEIVDKIECTLDNPMVDSHHDLVVSTMSIPSVTPSPIQRSSNVQAPQVPNTRQKIIWSVDGIQEYHQILAHHLPQIRERWLDPSSPSSMSILFQLTNMIMSETAAMFNKVVSLSETKPTRSSKVPHAVKQSNRVVVNAARRLTR